MFRLRHKPKRQLVRLPGNPSTQERDALWRIGITLLASFRYTAAKLPRGWSQQWREGHSYAVLVDTHGRDRVFVYPAVTLTGTTPDGKTVTRTQMELRIVPRFEVQDNGDGCFRIRDNGRGANVGGDNNQTRTWPTNLEAEVWLDSMQRLWRYSPASYWDDDRMQTGSMA